MIFSDLFNLEVARSGGIDEYDKGKVPFITNTTLDNGVGGYVEPNEGDKLFRGPAICISGLGFATVHIGVFLPKGNGGDSITVLFPKQEMEINELLFYAALFNVSHSWRFSFGRKTGRKKIGSLEVAMLYDGYKDAAKEEIDKYSKDILKSTKKSMKRIS